MANAHSLVTKLLRVRKASPKSTRLANVALKCDISFKRRKLLVRPSLTLNALYPVFRKWLFVSLITDWAEYVILFRHLSHRLLSWIGWLFRSRPVKEFLFGRVESCVRVCLFTPKSGFLSGEQVIISDRLAVLFLLTVIFVFGIGKVLEGEILALSGSSSHPRMEISSQDC
jgi:hypothetical protein